MSTVATSVRRLRSLSGDTVALLLLGLLAFVMVVLVHSGRLYIDTRPDLYLDPGALIRESLSTWVPGTGLGTTNYDNGYLPTAALLWVFQGVGLPPWLSMRLWRFLLVAVAALGARALLVDLTARREPAGPVARVTVAVLYAINPYVVVGAATTPVMLPFALLPWLLIALRRSFARWWHGAALVGLVFFAMGGLNAGVVPAFMLLAVPLVALDAVGREGQPRRNVLRGVLASAGACAVVSAYWIVATLAALGTANAVAAATEDPRAVAAVSSYAEVLRGLGSWLVYGGDVLGPYRPGFVSYLDNPVTVVASFTLPVLAMVGAWLSRRRLRGLATALTVTGLVLMVGGHPPDDPSPFGSALLWGFDHVPGLIAFRTTSKAGALAMLGMAVLGALAADAAWPRIARQWRPWLVATTALAVALSVTPVWLGRLFPGVLEVPDYWRVASADLDTRGDDGRILALPAETNALYRWRPRGVDDFAQVLIDRPVVYNRSFPDGPADAWNSLAGVNGALQQDPVPARLLSTYSKYVGVSDLLVRNDMLWELMGAPRPAQLVSVVDHDPGLDASALYGRSGDNTLGPKNRDRDEGTLAPLMRYSVRNSSGPVRLFPVGGQLLVAGDNAALASAVWSGLVDGDRPFRLLADMDDDEVTQALDDGARVLLTDTNRRHAANDHRLDVSGPLLGPDQDHDGLRALGDQSEQTVAEYDGIASVSATASGSVFGPAPTGRPFLAVDGDDSTAWQFGDFGTGVGNSITVDFGRPRTVSRIELERPGGKGARIGTVDVEAGGRTKTVSFGVQRSVTVTFPEPVSAASVTVTVDRVDGHGANQIGLSEIRVPGLKAREFARLPELPDSVDVPVDVLLGPSTLEHESTLDRLFSLPAAATYRLRAQVTGVATARPWRTCRPLLRVDGHAVTAKAAGPMQDDTLTLRGCGEVSLAAGAHRLQKAVPAVVARVYLRDTSVAAGPTTRLAEPEWQGDNTSYRVETPASTSDRYLVVAQGWDPRWHATIDGKNAGEPVQLNGFALAWRIPAGDAHTVELTFQPQARYRIALWLSLLCVVGCGALALLGVRRRRPEVTP